MLVIIPMAGEGKRFADAGYTLPKYLIEVKGEPIIAHVLKPFKDIKEKVDFVFVVLDRFHTKENHKLFWDTVYSVIDSPATVLIRQKVSGGALATVYNAIRSTEKYRWWSDSDKLVIANCDQAWGWDGNAFVQKLNYGHALLSFHSREPKFGYSRLNEKSPDLVSEIVEKTPVSNVAHVGVYGYHTIEDFMLSARDTFRNHIKVNGEYFISPTYNYLIEGGDLVFDVKSKWCRMLGCPEDVKKWEDEK